MAITIEEFGKEIHKILRDSKAVIISSAKYLIRGRYYDAKITDQNQLKAFIEKNCTEIVEYIIENKVTLLRTTFIHLRNYINEYEIDQHGVDLFKITYWFYFTLMKEYGYSSFKGKILLMALPIAMNNLLFLENGKFLDDRMIFKIKKSLLKGEVEYIFGKYGLYMIYKNCHLICQNNQSHCHANCLPVQEDLISHQPSPPPT